MEKKNEKKRWKSRVRRRREFDVFVLGRVLRGAEPTSDFMFAFARMFAYTRGVCLCALGEPLIVY